MRDINRYARLALVAFACGAAAACEPAEDLTAPASNRRHRRRARLPLTTCGSSDKTICKPAPRTNRSCTPTASGGFCSSGTTPVKR